MGTRGEPNGRRRVVVLGGGFGGIGAAQNLHKSDPELVGYGALSVVVVGRPTGVEIAGPAVAVALVVADPALLHRRATGSRPR